MNRILTFLGIVALLAIASCGKEKSTELGALASGGLQDSLGSCLPKTAGGNYIVGKALNDSNFIDVTMLVSKAGRYSISTDTVNGYYFSGNGRVSSSGVAIVRLKGSGTPLSEGNNTFTVSFDSTVCSVTVTVLSSGAPGTNPDHFPLTNNSWWTYQDSTGTNDSVKTVNVGTVTLAGNTYQMFVDSDIVNNSAQDTLYYRKSSANEYFEYGNADTYSIVTFDAEQKGEILILKEGLKTNDTWKSSEFSGTYSDTPFSLRYVFTCTDANATVTVNGHTFSNVYEINFKPQFSVTGPTGYQDEGLNITAFYAKGVGLIYENAVLTGNPSPVLEYGIKNWLVY